MRTMSLKPLLTDLQIKLATKKLWTEIKQSKVEMYCQAAGIKKSPEGSSWKAYPLAHAFLEYSRPEHIFIPLTVKL